jgi:hypothetical protein
MRQDVSAVPPGSRDALDLNAYASQRPCRLAKRKMESPLNVRSERAVQIGGPDTHLNVHGVLSLLLPSFVIGLSLHSDN